MKKILAIVLALTLIFAFASCANDTTTSSDVATSSAETKETLVMATNASFPPYEYLDGDQFAGIDIEIAGEIAKKLNMELEIKDVDFSTILGLVETGVADMGMAGMTVTEDRLKSVDFSTSYAKGVQVVIVKDGGKVASLEDLEKEGILIGVQQSTTGDIYASAPVEKGGYGSDKVVQYNTGNDAVAALVAGKVDAVIIDNEPAKSYVKVNEGLSILDTEYANEDYAICVAKTNTELLNKINTALDELTKDGTIANIVNKYIPADAE